MEIVQERRDLLSDPSKMKRIFNFSDLPTAVDAVKAIPDIYQGIRWSGIAYIHKEYVSAKHPDSGYAGAFIPNGSSHIAWFRNEGSLSAQSADEVFTLVSVTACAAWNDDMQLIITAYRESTETDMHIVTLLFGKPQTTLLQLENIDKVLFEASGGTLHPHSGGTASTAIVILTQLTLC
jgi:hypothetical protein